MCVTRPAALQDPTTGLWARGGQSVCVSPWLTLRGSWLTCGVVTGGLAHEAKVSYFPILYGKCLLALL